MTTERITKSGAVLSALPPFRIGQLVFWQPGRDIMQSELATVVEIEQSWVRIQIDNAVTGSAVYRAKPQHLIPACVECRVIPAMENSEICRMCHDYPAPARPLIEELPAPIQELLDKATSLAGFDYAGVETRTEGCPVCACYEMEVYIARLDGERSMLCAECGLDADYFAPVLALRSVNKTMLAELERLRKLLRQLGDPTNEMAWDKTRLDTVIKMAKRTMEVELDGNGND